VATRAPALFSTWSFHAVGLQELWLRVHRDNTALRQVAMNAGYRRYPGRDKSQKIKGAIWPMLGFALPDPRMRPDWPVRRLGAATEKRRNEMDNPGPPPS
jgi:RimJ/RimL family protein N-acetyltransferase